MAVNKVINKSTKSHGAMRNVIQYVLQNQKVKEGYVDITGPYSPDTITSDEVYKAFLAEKKLWGKDSGRMYAHNIISFHKAEKITPEECLEIGRSFIDRFFSGFQNLIGVHQDKDHLHIHIITNTVSFIDGLKLHQTKHDLEYQKTYTNELCRQRNLHVPEKGKHFDGTPIEEGELIAWNKDKYNLLMNDAKKSYVTDCAIAVMESKDNCHSREEFIERMQERGWHTSWTDQRKHITFQNDNGDKVRDSNLSKTFSMNITKETLTYEFKRQNESAEITDGRNTETTIDESSDLEQYYREIESAVAGLDRETVPDHQGTENYYRILPETAYSRSETDRKVSDTTQGEPDNDTDSFLEELKLRERASREKRDNSISGRADREAEYERSRVQREREAEAQKQRTGAENERCRRTGRSR